MAGWGPDSILDPSHQHDRVRFAQVVAKGTGLSFYTVWGWTKKEGGSFRNPLGVNYAGGRNPPQYPSVDVAAEQTVRFLQGSNYQDLRRVAATSFPDTKMGRLTEIGAESLAISRSPFGPWGHNLTDATAAQRRDYARTVAQAGAQLEEGIANIDADALRKAGAPPNMSWQTPGGAARQVGEKLGGWQDALLWPFRNPWRTLELVGGLGLLGVGIVLLARQAGAPMPNVPRPFQRGAVDPVEQAFNQGEEAGLRSAARSAGRSQGKARYSSQNQASAGTDIFGAPE